MTVKTHLNLIEDSACMLLNINREMPEYLRAYETELERMAMVLDSICDVAEADHMSVNNIHDKHDMSL